MKKPSPLRRKLSREERKQKRERYERIRDNKARRRHRKLARAKARSRKRVAHSKRIQDFVESKDNVRRKMWAAYRRGEAVNFTASTFMRVRTRESDEINSGNVHLGRYSWFSPNFLNGVEKYDSPWIQGRRRVEEYTMDELHYGPPYKSGGPFRHFKRSVPAYQVVNPGTYFSVNGDYKYEGGFLINRFSLPTQWDLAFTDQEVSYSSYGATGWNRFRPGRPGVDLGVALVEIRDVPHMLKTTAEGFFQLWKSFRGKKSDFFRSKSLGHQYLNAQFGWFPFLSDLYKTYKTFNRFDDMISQIRRDNDQWIYRKGTIVLVNEDEVISGSETQTAHSLCPSTSFYSNPLITGRYTVRRLKTQRIWFAGRFKYYIPDVGSVGDRLTNVLQSYGLSPNPGLIWELTPWSWMADWASNAGDVFANMGSGLAQNLVCKYAYVMGETKYLYMVDSEHKIGSSTYYASAHYSASHQVREAASPFGFGLQIGDLSPYQLSIISALGLSRQGH